MREEFLHYVWQYKKFEFSNLKTILGEDIVISSVGTYLKQSGPDFFNAKISIADQKWAGNIELHLKSSDWYLHRHEEDHNYDNVILHVVWEYDVPIFGRNNIEIPTLELKKYVHKGVIEKYKSLTSVKSWIYCENQIGTLDSFFIKNWQERLFFERLEQKSTPIQDLLKETSNDWEAVLFCLLAKNFGLNINGEVFLKMAQSIPFSVIRKESADVKNLEALFFGMTDLFPAEMEETYSKSLKNKFDYLLQKYQLKKTNLNLVQFFKHRPDNFPTIRLAQLAMLYHSQKNIFSQIIASKNVTDIYQLFDIKTSQYWQNHYQFEKESPKKEKKLSKEFIDLIIINTIIPIHFIYAKNLRKENSEAIIKLVQEIKPENNTIIQKFSQFGIKTENAFDTQSLLQLKKEYCDTSKCLKCSIGIHLIKS